MLKKIAVLAALVAIVGGCSHNPYVRARQTEAGAVGAGIGYLVGRETARPYYPPAYGPAPARVIGPSMIYDPRLGSARPVQQPTTIIIIERR